MLKDAQQWRSSDRRELFVKTKSGKYARLEFRLDTFNETSAFHNDGYLNPSGSRNLESDPQELIDPKRIAKVGLEKAIEEVKAKSKKAALN